MNRSIFLVNDSWFRNPVCIEIVDIIIKTGYILNQSAFVRSLLYQEHLVFLQRVEEAKRKPKSALCNLTFLSLFPYILFFIFYFLFF